jgi:integrase
VPHHVDVGPAAPQCIGPLSKIGLGYIDRSLVLHRPLARGCVAGVSDHFHGPLRGVLRATHWRPRVFCPARDSLKAFPKVTPHDLRHTAASLAVSAGGNVLALARMLGHEDPSLTLKVYADLFDTDLDALADVLTQARLAALEQPSTATADSESAGKNVPGTLEQTA